MATKTFPSLTHTDREGFPSLTLTEEKDLFFILEIWSHQKANFFFSSSSRPFKKERFQLKRYWMSMEAILEVCSDKSISYKPGTQASLDFQLLQNSFCVSRTVPEGEEKGRSCLQTRHFRKQPRESPSPPGTTQ